MAYRPYLGVQTPGLPPSPYFQDEEEDPQSPTMQIAMNRARAGRGSGYGAGGSQAGALTGLADATTDTGRSKPLVSKYATPPEVSKAAGTPEDEDPDEAKSSPYLVAGNASWTKSAPEAAGSESFSTTPENRPPRQEEPIGKYELPRINSDPQKSPSKWDTVRAKDAEIEKETKRLGNFGSAFVAATVPGITRLWMANLQGMRQDRDDLARDAAYEDDRKGAGDRERETARNLRAKTRADAAVEAAKIKATQKAAEEQAIKNTGRVDDSGNFVYIDPATGAWKSPPGIPGKPSILDEDNPEAPAPKPYLPSFAGEKKAARGAPHFTTDDSGNVAAIDPTTGEVKKYGKLGKTTVHPEGEGPEAKKTAKREEEARRVAGRARKAYEDDPRNKLDKTPEQHRRGAAEAYQQAYDDTMNPPQQKKVGDEREAILADGTRQIMVWDGKQYVPKSKVGGGMARSHGR